MKFSEIIPGCTFQYEDLAYLKYDDDDVRCMDGDQTTNVQEHAESRFDPDEEVEAIDTGCFVLVKAVTGTKPFELLGPFSDERVAEMHRVLTPLGVTVLTPRPTRG